MQNRFMSMLLRKRGERFSCEPYVRKVKVVWMPGPEGIEAENDNTRDVENKNIQNMERNPEPMRTWWSVRGYRDRRV